MCSGSEAGSYLKLIDFVSLNSRLDSDKEEEEEEDTFSTRLVASSPMPPWVTS